MEAAGLGPAEINMGITEIILLIIGAGIFAVSFFIPEKYSKQDERDYKEIRDKLKMFLKQELQMAQLGIEEKTDEVIVAATEKAERYMERITNEKIMAVQEYSDTVLEQIHKNHEEAVFLYDMLNNKHDQIKITATDINNKVEEAKADIQSVAEGVVHQLVQKNIHDTLQEEMQDTVRNMVQDSVHDTVNAVLKERAQEEYRETVPHGLFSQQTAMVAEERKEEEFHELSLDTPEIIMQEEQPFLVQQVKKVTPKRKTPSRKPSTREKAGMEIKPDTEIQFSQEPDAGTNSKEKILRLHKEGKSDMIIAKELGLGIGEVRLVIGLFE